MFHPLERGRKSLGLLRAPLVRECFKECLGTAAPLECPRCFTGQSSPWYMHRHIPALSGIALRTLQDTCDTVESCFPLTNRRNSYLEYIHKGQKYSSLRICNTAALEYSFLFSLLSIGWRGFS